MTGIWLLPTRARPEQAERLLAKCPPGVWLLVSEDDPRKDDYIALAAHTGSSLFLTNVEGMAAKCQQVWESLYNAPTWVGILTDDLEPVTEGWANALTAQITGWNIVASNDGWQQRMQGAVVFSGDLLRAVGYLAPPNLKHLYFDDVWESLGKTTGCLQYDMNVLVNHAHVNRTGNSDGTAQKVTTFWAGDEHAFATWRIEDQQRAINRITFLMESHGLRADVINLSDVKLLISTPCGSGSYRREYVKSMLKTVIALRQWGAHVDWHEHPNASDLPLARAMLFGKFYRSPFTHMLQIDDDMGWEPVDVARMLLLKQEFVAAAGPRKAVDDVQKFAFSNADDFGNILPVHQHAVTGLLDVTDVGGAFVMIDQACARRMVEAYGGLEFTASDGRPYWHLYLPFVLNKRAIGEDFAFCYRWRAAGGRVLVLPDVRLQHAGAYTWVGAASDYINFEMKQAAE